MFTEGERLVRAGDESGLRKFIRLFGKHGDFTPGDTLLEELLFMAVSYKYDIMLLESGADVTISPESSGCTPLHYAVLVDNLRIVDLFLSHGADANAVNTRGRTPLFKARSRPVAELLNQHGANIHQEDQAGHTALSYHLSKNPNNPEWEFVELLLDGGVAINFDNKSGDTVLHLAMRTNAPLSTLEKLIASGAESNGRNNRGETPLHLAAATLDGASSAYAHEVKFLLSFYAHKEIRAEDQEGLEAFHVALRATYRGHILMNEPTLDLMRSWCARGAKWDNAIVNRGSAATKAYLGQLLLSNNVILRRKICIVGPSNWGKTSLIKSLQRQKPILVHPDDRTIGIDKFPLTFPETFAAVGTPVQHEVTFWDFAGHDEYQVSHALFFSRRTLYLVCIDLSAYTIAFYKAEIMTHGDSMAFEERLWRPVSCAGSV